MNSLRVTLEFPFGILLGIPATLRRAAALLEEEGFTGEIGTESGNRFFLHEINAKTHRQVQIVKTIRFHV